MSSVADNYRFYDPPQEAGFSVDLSDLGAVANGNSAAGVSNEDDVKLDPNGRATPLLTAAPIETLVDMIKRAFPEAAHNADQGTVRRAPGAMKELSAQLTRGKSLSNLLNFTAAAALNDADNAEDNKGEASVKDSEEEDDVQINSSTLISREWRIETKEGKPFPVFFFHTVFSLDKYHKMIVDDKLFVRARVNLSFERATQLQPQVILELEDKQWVIGTCGTFTAQEQAQLAEAQQSFNKVGLVIQDINSGGQLDVTEYAGNVVLDFTGQMATAQHFDSRNNSMQAVSIWTQFERNHPADQPFPSGFFHFYALCRRSLNLNSYMQFLQAIRTEKDGNHLAFTYNSLGIMCKRLGRKDIGVNLLTESIFLRPAYVEALISLGMWLTNENREVALNLIARGIKVRPAEGGKLTNFFQTLGFGSSAEFIIDMKRRGKSIKVGEVPAGLTRPTAEQLEEAIAFVTQQAENSTP